MFPATRKILVTLLAALPSVTLAAGKFTWFDQAPTDAGVLPARASAFGAELYSSSATQFAADSKVSVFGDYAANGAGDESASKRFANFGLRWQHRVSSTDRVAVSAQQGDSVLSMPVSTLNGEALDTRAAVSWTRDLSWSWKPSITGGVFLGDESGRDDTARQYGRRYYGLTVGGEFRLLQSHTPYVSFRMERSLYDLPESAGAASGASVGNGNSISSVRSFDDSSRLAAGWRWQLQRGWSMQAEASYGFSIDAGAEPLPQERERSRVFFGTRFDFR
jgi:hypothetical protein